MHFWKKKSHTSEEGGAHLRISFSHSLINLKNPTNQTSEKLKKILKISSFYACVPKNTIIWGKVPEIQSETEFFATLAHFLPCYPSPPNNPENQNFEKMKQTSGDVIILNLCNKKTQSYNVCLLRYGMRQT